MSDESTRYIIILFFFAYYLRNALNELYEYAVWTSYHWRCGHFQFVQWGKLTLFILQPILGGMALLYVMNGVRS